MNKIILIRGKVGSGKSTVAKLLQKKLSPKTALFDRDYFYHKVFPWEDNNKIVNEALLSLTRLYLDNGYSVILEGSFTLHENKTLIDALLKLTKPKTTDSHFFYLNTTLQVSLKRNKLRKKGKNIKDEWIREWHAASTPGKINKEVIINTNEIDKKAVVKKILLILQK